MIIDKTLEFELQIGVLLFNVVANVQYKETQSILPDEPIEYTTTLDWVDVESCELLIGGVDVKCKLCNNSLFNHAVIDNEFITEVLDTDKVTIADKTLTWYIEGEVENLIGV